MDNKSTTKSNPYPHWWHENCCRFCRHTREEVGERCWGVACWIPIRKEFIISNDPTIT
jgi:hypothetical protein